MTVYHRYFLNRQMQMALYALKRQYGGPIVVCRLLRSEVDMRTGEAAVDTQSFRIGRAIILPAVITREVARTVSLITSDKPAVQGGGFDSGKKTFVIDRRDARTLVISQDDWIVWNGQKYQIEKLEELEFDAGWVVAGKLLIGETGLETEFQQTVEASDAIEVEEEADEEV